MRKRKPPWLRIKEFIKEARALSPTRQLILCGYLLLYGLMFLVLVPIAWGGYFLLVGLLVRYFRW
jgi:hypothetical protein